MISQLLNPYSPYTEEIDSHADLAQFYRGLVRAPLSVIDYETRSLLRAELTAEPEHRAQLVLHRLRAWLELEPKDAALILAAHGRELKALTEPQRETLLEAERDAVFNALTPREFERLRIFVPWLADLELPRPARPVNRALGLMLALETESVL